MANESSNEKPLFRELNAEDEYPEATIVESFCVNCEENGQTRILLTKIPYYKEVILMSFHCEHCGLRNNELQSGGQIEEFGVKIKLEIKSPDDMNRQVVKSDFTSISIPHIQFEIPSQSQKGEVTTIEGIINRTITALEQDQAVRRVQHPEEAAKIDDFVKVLNKIKLVEEPYLLIFEDISGNSFVENKFAPASDPNCTIEKFKRTQDQDHLLGIYRQDEVTDDQSSGRLQDEEQKLDLQGEILSFNTNCPNCGTPCATNMKITKIPYFKEVVIMATSCDACGHRTNEVKSAGGIEPKGIKIQVIINGSQDFSRDLLKSETCRILIPEIDLEAGAMTIGGKFTTVEGILKDLKDGLGKGSATFGIFGDSRGGESGQALNKCVVQLEEVLQGNKCVTMILDDPAGNSYVQSLSDEGLDDGLKIDHYERTFEQNEDLGVNDMKTEGYEENLKQSGSFL